MNGILCRHFRYSARLQRGLSAICLQHPSGFHCGVGIKAGDESLKKVRAICGRKLEGLGFQDFKLGSHGHILRSWAKLA